MDNKIVLDGTEYAHNDKLQRALDKVIAEMKNEFPLFPFPSPFSEIEWNGENLIQAIKLGDETLDEIFGASGYVINRGYLKIYYDELIKWGIDKVLEEITVNYDLKSLINLVKGTGDLIINSSDKQIFIQNRILLVLAECNQLKEVGIIIQVLYLRGVIMWFEYCDLNDGDPGSIEARNLLDWVYEKFEEACFYYFMILRNNVRSKPITDYLEILEVGKACFDHFNGNPVNSNVIEDNSSQGNIIKNGGELKKVVDENLTLKSIIYDNFFTDAKKYYSEKINKIKKLKQSQYGQLIDEFIKKNWVKPEFKNISYSQMRIIVLNEFNIDIKPDTLSRKNHPKYNEFEDLKFQNPTTLTL